MTSASDRPRQVCTRCIMDTTDPEIEFDEQGVCNHCKRYDERARNEVFTGEEARRRLEQAVARIRESGKRKKYDCLIGVSGGVDSTAVAYHVKRLGLRPLAVHLDNGWDSELAASNAEKTLNALDIDLYTHVLEREEFKDLQLAFLRSSVPNAEIPTDHAIISLMFHAAARNGVRYIIQGGNLATEGIMARSWTYINRDLRHLTAIHRRFGHRPLRTFPKMSLFRWVHYTFVKKIRYWPLLNYLDYDKEAAKELLKKELGWQDYGLKHYESIYTRFFQSYILPKKFNIDKRKAHYSALICSGALTRQEALKRMEEPAYPPDTLQEDRQYVIKKLGLTEQEFEEIMALPPKRHDEYPSNKWLYDKLAFFVNVAKRRAKSI